MEEIRQTLSEIYPEVDLDKLFEEQPDKSLNWYANFIVSNPDVVHRLLICAPSEPVSDNDDNTKLTDADLFKQQCNLIAELLEILRNDLENPPPMHTTPLVEFQNIFVCVESQCLSNILCFTECRSAASFVIAFFVTNKMFDVLIPFIPLPLIFWKRTNFLRRFRRCQRLPVTLPGFKHCLSIINERYSTIINKETLFFNTPVFDGEKFTCSICYEDFPINLAVFCGNETRFNDECINEDNAIPCSSTDAVRPPTQEQHKFCVDCVHRHARAATESQPIAESSTGLKCMAYECKQPILFSKIRAILPKQIFTMLESRVLNENLAAFNDIEKCPSCDYGVVIEVPKEIDKVFRCQNCKKNWCRLCELQWDDNHFGRSCDEAAKIAGIDRKKRDLERKVNEAIMRRCHRCSLQFTKDEGCNKITCRCGATQCYLCRTKDIDYTHFCSHLQIPGKTENCCKRCLLWDDSYAADRKKVKKIYADAGEKVPKGVGPEPKRRRVNDINQGENFNFARIMEHMRNNHELDHRDAPLRNRRPPQNNGAPVFPPLGPPGNGIRPEPEAVGVIQPPQAQIVPLFQHYYNPDNNKYYRQFLRNAVARNLGNNARPVHNTGPPNNGNPPNNRLPVNYVFPGGMGVLGNNGNFPNNFVPANNGNPGNNARAVNNIGPSNNNGNPPNNGVPANNPNSFPNGFLGFTPNFGYPLPNQNANGRVVPNFMQMAPSLANRYVPMHDAFLGMYPHNRVNGNPTPLLANPHVPMHDAFNGMYYHNRNDGNPIENAHINQTNLQFEDQLQRLLREAEYANIIAQQHVEEDADQDGEEEGNNDNVDIVLPRPEENRNV